MNWRIFPTLKFVSVSVWPKSNISVSLSVILKIMLRETQMTKFNVSRYKLIGSFPELWMHLETVIQSEVSQRKKYTLTHLWNLGKWYRCAYLQGRKRDADIENTHVYTAGMNWEVGIDIYTLPCVKQRAGGKLVCTTGSSAWCPVIIQRGGTEAWEGGSKGRWYTYTHSWFTSRSSRN